MAHNLDTAPMDAATYFGEPHTRQRSWLEICRDPRLLDAIESLIGPNIVLVYSSFFVKPADGLDANGNEAQVAWHQDNNYWAAVHGTEGVITVWLAVDDADVANGTMKLLPGTHRPYMLTWTQAKRPRAQSFRGRWTWGRSWRPLPFPSFCLRARCRSTTAICSTAAATIAPAGGELPTPFGTSPLTKGTWTSARTPYPPTSCVGAPLRAVEVTSMRAPAHRCRGCSRRRRSTRHMPTATASCRQACLAQRLLVVVCCE